MSNWLEKIRSEAAVIGPEQIGAVTPADPLKDGDTVVDTLSDDLQRLFALSNDYALRYGIARKSAEAAYEAGNKEQGDELFRDMNALKAQAEMVYAMALTSVRSAYGLWSTAGLTLREGWQLVIMAEEPAKPRHSVLIVRLDSADANHRAH